MPAAKPKPTPKTKHSNPKSVRVKFRPLDLKRVEEYNFPGRLAESAAKVARILGPTAEKRIFGLATTILREPDLKKRKRAIDFLVQEALRYLRGIKRLEKQELIERKELDIESFIDEVETTPENLRKQVGRAAFSMILTFTQHVIDSVPDKMARYELRKRFQEEFGDRAWVAHSFKP